MKKITLTKDGFRTVWYNGERGMINVDVFHGDNEKPCVEWSYPKLGGSSIAGNAAIWLDQAILQTRQCPVL